MASRIEDALAKLGVVLPDAPAPRANYVPAVRTGSLVFIAGQLPLENGQLPFQGRVGESINAEKAQQAARLCALNILAVLKNACEGDLDRVRRCVRLGGFVASAADFLDQPQVVNGASDLIVAAMGDAGKHARTAVGVAQLPRGVPVEVDAIFEVD
jgi:enamine deaminase RidA (YjgF/YER057c/UK114 family)